MNTNRNLLLGGLGLAAGVGALAYLITRKENVTSSAGSATSSIDRETCIKILKELKRELFPIFNSLAMYATQVRESTGNRIGTEELKDVILKHNNHIQQNIKDVNRKVLAKYNTDEVAFQQACEVTYKNDRDVATLLNETRENLDIALTGQLPNTTSQIPEFLTPILTLQIMSKIMKNALVKMQELFQDLKAQGHSIDIKNPAVQASLGTLRLEDVRHQILAEAGLDKFDDPPTKIFQYANQKYSQTNPDRFMDKLAKLEAQHQKAMESLLKDSEFTGKYIDGVGVHLFGDSNKDSGLVEIRTEVAPSVKKTVLDEKQSKSELYTKKAELFNSAPDLGALKRQISVEFKKELANKKEFGESQVYFDTAVNTLFKVISGLDHAATVQYTQQQKDAAVTQKVLADREDEEVVGKDLDSAAKINDAIIEQTEAEETSPDVKIKEHAE